jgi:hypothetical protein
MATNKAKSTSKKESKVFDVAKPGETPVDQTSRPIIVNHSRMIQQDPMVVDTNATTPAENPEKSRPITRKAELKIQPVGEESDTKLETTVVSKAEVPAQEEISRLDRSADTSEPSKEETADSDEASDSDAAAVDMLAGEASTKLEKQKQNEEELKKAQEIQKLVVSKQYFVHTKTPPGKRNSYILILLLLIAFAGGAWYMLGGPGKSLWVKETAPTLVTTTPIVTPLPQPASKPALTEYKNPAFGLTFSYPKEWKAEVGKDASRTGVDTLTLSAPTQKIKLTTGNEVDAFMRLKLYILNTVDLKKYPTSSVGLTECSTTDLIIENNKYKLAFTSAQSTNGASRTIISTGDCSANKPYVINDLFQLANKKNTYSVSLEYVLSDDYLKKTGITKPDEIALSQKNGVSVKQTDFMAADTYKQAVSLFQSLKSL